MKTVTIALLLAKWRVLLWLCAAASGVGLHVNTTVLCFLVTYYDGFCCAQQVDVCVEGLSVIPLLTANASIPWKSAAFSQYPRMIVSGNVMMGYSMRTDKYRYTEWIFYDDAAHQPLWKRNRLYAELYNHVTDPEENNNVAEDERYSTIRKRLHRQLRNGWRMAVPSKSHPNCKNGFCHWWSLWELELFTNFHAYRFYIFVLFMSLPPHNFGRGVIFYRLFVFHVRSSVHLSGQILLVRYLLNGLSSLNETYCNIHYPLLMTWLDFGGQRSRSSGEEGIHIDAGTSSFSFVWWNCK